MRTPRGINITVSGAPGVGKSIVLRAIERALREANLDVTVEGDNVYNETATLDTLKLSNPRIVLSELCTRT